MNMIISFDTSRRNSYSVRSAFYLENLSLAVVFTINPILEGHFGNDKKEEMGEVDEMFEDLLKSNSLDSQDSGALTDYIKKAREAETKAKVQIYTLKGKKSFEKLKKMEEEEEEDVENENISHNNDNFDDLRRQIEQYKELERLELENIEKLKKERELQQLFYNIDKQEVQTQQEETTRSAPIEQLKIPKFTPPTDPQKSPKFLQEPAPVPQLIQAPIVIQEQISSPVITPPLVVQSSSPSIPSINSNNIAIPQGNLSLSSELLLSPRSRKGRAPETPSSFLVKVISIQWDNAPKSKKNNKVIFFNC